jgi:hypothetical protein
VIGRYGGVVEKFIGDAVMAVWGTPVATEGDAERAVRAALDLVAAVADLGAESGLPGLAARAGVVTGEVAVNLRAVGEGMVAGDAVNTASRVQAAAERGSVLADVPTHRLTGSAIAFADAGEHTLKGKAEPQRLWRAVRVLSAVGGSQRVDGLEAPLTGRDAELRTIKDLFHAAAERRVPRLVLVSGPPGVGKSRLGWEFEKYADGLKAEVWWHRGRCLSYGEGVAFWALAQIVRQRLGIAEEDPPEAAAVKLAAGRRPQAASYLRESARLADRVGDNFLAGRALLNLADALAPIEPAAAAEVARTAAGALRRTGARRQLAAAIMNVAEALIQAGDWDSAVAELTPRADSDALADIEEFAVERGWLAALRGDDRTAEDILTALQDIRASEDPQVRAGVSILEAFGAAARRQPADALRHARAILGHAEAIGISNIYLRWAWPLAARCAHELADTAAVRDLLALLDSYQPGYLAPMLQAEGDLARARLAVGDGDATAAASFATAIASLREQSTPYHLAHGLLDHAEYLTAAGSGVAAGAPANPGATAASGSAANAETAAAAIAEARDIASRLRCQPLLDRAVGLTPRDPVTATPQDSPRVAR